MLYLKTELSHYGVKGMKWGVRHDDRNLKNTSSKHKWSKKKKILTGLAVVGGTMAVLGGIYLYKEFNSSLIGVGYYRFDKLSDMVSNLSNSDGVSLKKGTVFQRISSEAVEDYTKRGQEYVSYKFRDNARYKKRLPNESWLRGSTSYVHKIRTTSDISSPSSREAASIFLKFKPDASESDYKNFMAQGIRDETSELRRKFVGEVRKRGYNAVLDTNDQSWTNSPLILLDPSKTIANARSRKLGVAERVVSTYFI